jgi:hypothetical protein
MNIYFSLLPIRRTPPKYKLNEIQAIKQPRQPTARRDRIARYENAARRMSTCEGIACRTKIS